MPYYRVYFRYISGNKVKRDSVRLAASSIEDAKKRVIKGEKPRLIAVDKVRKL